jgi:KaiC/GvpD/RAD55 family RecA-like ATPase
LRVQSNTSGVDERVSTGLAALDRQFGGDEEDGEGGIPAGTLLVLEVPPGSQYEPLVWTLMRELATVYLVTLRSEAAIADDVEVVDPDPEVRIHDVGFETPIRNASGVIELVDWQANIVVDTVTPLERTEDHERYVNFLNELKKHLTATGSIGVLVATKVDSIPAGREYTLTVADFVWELQTRVQRVRVEHDLLVRKFRGGDLPEETVKLRLDEEVGVDTSRDIA